MDRDPRIRLFIDIGTNCEIVLGGRDWLLADGRPRPGPRSRAPRCRCGCAPRRGDRSGDDHPDRDLNFTVSATRSRAPVRLRPCRRVTALVEAGLLDGSGRFVPAEDASRIAPGPRQPPHHRRRGRVFMLHGDIYLSQRDIRELQFAKAAIATGWRILLEEAGLTEEDVKQCCWRGPVRLLPCRRSPRSGSASSRRPGPPRGRRRNVAGEGAKDGPAFVRERAAALALLEG